MTVRDRWARSITAASTMQRGADSELALTERETYKSRNGKGLLILYYTLETHGPNSRARTNTDVAREISQICIMYRSFH